MNSQSQNFNSARELVPDANPRADATRATFCLNHPSSASAVNF